MKRGSLNLNQSEHRGLVLESIDFREHRPRLPQFGRVVIDKQTNQVKVNFGTPHSPKWDSFGGSSTTANKTLNANISVEGGGGVDDFTPGTNLYWDAVKYRRLHAQIDLIYYSNDNTQYVRKPDLFRVEVTQVAHGFTVGQAIRLNGSVHELAQGDVIGNSDVIGIVVKIIDTDTFVYQYGGLWETTGYTSGTNYFLSTAVAGDVVVEPTYSIGQIRTFIATGTPTGLLIEIAQGEEIMELTIPTGTDLTEEVNQIAHGFVAGDAIRHNGTIYVKAQGDVPLNAGVLGIVIAVSDANNFVYQYGGFLTVGTWTDGEAYFLSPTTAGLVVVEPTYNVGEVRQYIGTGTPSGLLLELDLGDEIVENLSPVGSGTLNYVIKWTPDGNSLGNSQIRDDGVTISAGIAPVATQFFTLANSTLLTTFYVANSYSGGGTPKTAIAGVSSGGGVGDVGVYGQGNGTGAVNVGGLFSAINGVTNWGLYVAAGYSYLQDVQIGSGDYVTVSSSGGELKRVTKYTVLQETHEEFGDPNGFINPVNTVTCTFTNGTRTLQISPTGASFVYYTGAQRYEKTGAESIVIDDTEGMWYVYYNGDTLYASQTFDPDIILTWAFVAAIYWDAINNKQIYFGREFRHTANMGSKTHSYLHSTRGFSLASGGALGNIIVDANGSLNSHAQFSNEATEAWDEDAQYVHAARLSTTNIPVYYRSGLEVDGIWRVDETSNFPLLLGGTGLAVYNKLTTGTWSNTECASGNFVLAHVFTGNDTDRPYNVIIGQEQYITKGLARDGAENEITNLYIEGMPSQEWRFLGTIILETKSSFTNSVKSRIVSTTSGGDYIDLRLLVNFGDNVSTIVTDHNVLAGIQGGTTNEYFHFTSVQHVDLSAFSGTLTTKGDILYYDGGYQRLPISVTTGNVLAVSAGGIPGWVTASSGGVGGTGTVDYVARWTPDGTTLGISIIRDNGTNVGVNISPSITAKLYAYSNNQDSAIKGHSQRNTLTGNAVEGYANGTGLIGRGGYFTAQGTTSNSNYGVSGFALNAPVNYGALFFATSSANLNYGFHGVAQNATTNYGAWLEASGGTTNWGLYVTAGDSYLQKTFLNSVANIGTPAGTDKVLVLSGTEVRYAAFSEFGGTSTFSGSCSQYFVPYAVTNNVFANSALLSNGTTVGIGIAATASYLLRLYNTDSTVKRTLEIYQSMTGSGDAYGARIQVNGVAAGINYGMHFNVSDGTGGGYALYTQVGDSYFGDIVILGSVAQNASPGAGTRILSLNTSTNVVEYVDFSDFSGSGVGTVAGTGTVNYVTKWSTGGANIQNSTIIDDGTNIAIGTGIVATGRVYVYTSSIANTFFATNQSASGTATGVAGTASGAATENRGGSFNASTGTTNIGIYASATGGTAWSVYASAGEMYLGTLNAYALAENTSTRVVVKNLTSGALQYLTIAEIGTAGGFSGGSLPSGSTGDLLYYNGGWNTRAATTDGYVLTLSSGLPVWAAASGGSLSGGQSPHVVRWTGTTTISYGILQDDGSNAAIGQAPSSDTMLRLNASTDTYGAYITNTTTGATNYGLYVSATIATTSYAVYVAAGSTYLQKTFLNSVTAYTTSISTTSVLVLIGNEIQKRSIAALVSDAGGGGSPGGSGTQIQYRASASTFGGLTYADSASGHLRVLDSGILYFGTSSNTSIKWASSALKLSYGIVERVTIGSAETILWNNSGFQQLGITASAVDIYDSLRVLTSYGGTLKLTVQNGTGDIDTAGFVDAATGFKYNGTAGHSSTKIFQDNSSNTHTVVVQGGIITSWNVTAP